MKNLMPVQIEIQRRNKAAIVRGYFETPSQIKSRLLNNLMKSWYGHDGTLWTTRAYLIKYKMDEYRSIVDCLRNIYRGFDFLGDKGDNLDQFNFFHDRANGIQKNYISYDGRLPVSEYEKTN